MIAKTSRALQQLTPLRAALRYTFMWQIAWPLLYSFAIPACQPCDDIMSLLLLVSNLSHWLFVGAFCFTRRELLSRAELFLIAHGFPLLSMVGVLIYRLHEDGYL